MDEEYCEVPCDLCGIYWAVDGTGEGIILQGRSPEETAYGPVPRQIKLCVDCALQASLTLTQLLKEKDICEHGVICGEWCEPCNKAYKAARLENESDELTP